MSYQIFENLLKTEGSTVYRVAKSTGIPASTFTDWKNGRSVPKAEKLKKIAAYFDVPLDLFLDGAGGSISGRKRMIPIIGEIRAGSPIITEETLLGYESAEVEDTEDYFYLRVLGDSMKNIGMVDGSLVLFHKQQYAENGDIVACLVDGDCATVKRFYKKNHRIVLQPENDAYRPITLSPEDFEIGRARILGVAIEAKTKF